MKIRMEKIRGTVMPSGDVIYIEAAGCAAPVIRASASAAVRHIDQFRRFSDPGSLHDVDVFGSVDFCLIAFHFIIVGEGKIDVIFELLVDVPADFSNPVEVPVRDFRAEERTPAQFSDGIVVVKTAEIAATRICSNVWLLPE